MCFQDFSATGRMLRHRISLGLNEVNSVERVPEIKLTWKELLLYFTNHDWI